MLYSCCLWCQERYVTIDDQEYRIRDLGNGQVTVVFENGMSDSLEVWGAIPDSVAAKARIFQYDRADIGKSGLSQNQRTIPNMVRELRGILKDQRICPPYVLVGHSMGGLIVRYFASHYPGEVKGMLLLDPVPESFWKTMNKQEYKEYFIGGNEWYETRFKPQYRKEWYAFQSNLGYMDSLTVRGSLPVILISSSSWKWYKYHKDIAAKYENAKHFELEGEHHIFKNHPEFVMRCILELLGSHDPEIQ